MNTLDESSRDAYRRSLLEQVQHERFPAIPWAERHRKPSSLKVLAEHRAEDTPGNIAERVEILNAAMLDGRGRVVQLADRQAA